MLKGLKATTPGSVRWKRQPLFTPPHFLFFTVCVKPIWNSSYGSETDWTTSWSSQDQQYSKRIPETSNKDVEKSNGRMGTAAKRKVGQSKKSNKNSVNNKNLLILRSIVGLANADFLMQLNIMDGHVLLHAHLFEHKWYYKRHMKQSSQKRIWDSSNSVWMIKNWIKRMSSKT